MCVFLLFCFLLVYILILLKTTHAKLDIFIILWFIRTTRWKYLNSIKKVGNVSFICIKIEILQILKIIHCPLLQNRQNILVSKCVIVVLDVAALPCLNNRSFIRFSASRLWRFCSGANYNFYEYARVSILLAFRATGTVCCSCSCGMHLESSFLCVKKWEGWQKF